MMPLYSLVLVAFAIFFYRAGEFENCPGVLWAAVSVVISLLTWQWLRWGPLGMILCQIGLFVGIGVFRVVRKP